MGGKKKVSLKKSKIQPMVKTTSHLSRDKKRSSVIPLNPKDPKILEEIKKMKALTPYQLASHYNVRISVAKKFLKTLEDTRLIKKVAGNHSLKIYSPNLQ